MPALQPSSRVEGAVGLHTIIEGMICVAGP